MFKMYLNFLTLFFLLSQGLMAGVGSSGGGWSVVCRGDYGEITKAMLLDLYEGIFEENIKLKEPTGFFEQEVRPYLEEINRVNESSRLVTQYQVRKFIQYFQRNFIFLNPEEHELPEIHDVGESIDLPEGCKLEPLAVYLDDRKKFYVNEQIWEAMDSLNQMAMVAHELIYNEYRAMGEVTSERVRKIISRLFSATPYPTLTEGVPQGSLRCMAFPDQKESAVSEFFIFKEDEKQNTTYLQFTTVLGRYAFFFQRIAVNANIDVLGLVPTEVEGGGHVLTPLEPEANLLETYAMTGIFGNLKIEIDYRQHQPFAITLLDRKGKVLAHSLIKMCHRN